MENLRNQENLAAGKAADRSVVAIPVFLEREMVLVEEPHLAIVTKRIAVLPHLQRSARAVGTRGVRF